MLLKKKIALFTCLFSFISCQNSMNAMENSSKTMSAFKLNDEELKVLNNFKKGNWKITNEYSTGSYSSRVCRVHCDGDDVAYVLKVLHQNDEQSYNCEKLACDKFKGKKFENICPPLNCQKEGKNNYYVIYEAADSNTGEDGDAEKILKGISNEQLIELWNDLLFQKIKAMKDVNKLGLLHVDGHIKNWATLFYMENGKPKVKTKLIDFGETMDISGCGPQEMPIYYPAIVERESENAVSRDLILFLDSLMVDRKLMEDQASDYMCYPEGNGKGCRFTVYLKFYTNIKDYINDFSSKICSINLNQRNTLLDTLYSMLRLSPDRNVFRINKSRKFFSRINKNKKDFISIWPSE